jgi:hypothetical protein
VPAQIAVYWERLAANSDETFVEAVRRVIDSERAFPVIATLHGYCDRVREERAARMANEMASVPRLRPGERLPVCATCLDSGWVGAPSAMPNLPGTLMNCPDCDTAKRGLDPTFNATQVNAYKYYLDREHARYPAVNGDAKIGGDLNAAIAGVATGLRMNREGPRPARPRRDDEEGAHSRWTPPMPKAGAA